MNENNAKNISEELFFTYADNLENPKKLTVAQVRAFGGFDNYSDSAVQDLIEELYQISIVSYKIYLSEKKN